jgi:hypothetical protein
MDKRDAGGGKIIGRGKLMDKCDAGGGMIIGRRN